jgi:hypothetical protein
MVTFLQELNPHKVDSGMVTFLKELNPHKVDSGMVTFLQELNPQQLQQLAGPAATSSDLLNLLQQQRGARPAITAATL